jgi:hypothetical protein
VSGRKHVTLLSFALPLSAALVALILSLLLHTRPAGAAEQPEHEVQATLQVTPLPPPRQTDRRGGICYSFYYGTPPDRPFIPLAYNAGSRWDRFDFAWPRLEPANDQWDQGVLRAYDEVVDALHQGGIENIVGILLWTPDWAATSGQRGMTLPGLEQRPSGWYAPTSGRLAAPFVASAASSPPQGLFLPWNDPDNHWGDFVYHIVSRYRDRVKYWEMWNEPEWNYFWTGTSTDYAQLLKVGYQATKAACPDCKVLFGGLHYWANQNYFRWVLYQLNQDPKASQNNYFFDIMSVHLYSRSSTIYDEVLKIRAGMVTFNTGDHPIWLTETGVPVWNDATVDPDPVKYDYAATQNEAAAYVIQSYANAWASGVERYFFFRAHDADMGEYFGLIRNDRSLRPAYVAYQIATTYLISPTFTTRAVTGRSVNVTLWGTPHGRISVLWNPGPTAAVYTLTAAMPAATLVYTSGVTRIVTTTSDTYTFTLPGATANLVSNTRDYIIGGDPLIVIESERTNQPPTSTIHPLPEVTLTPTFTVTWQGWDNESGILFYDVQVRDGPGGMWASWKQLTTSTSGIFTGTHGHTYCFRVRATDRVGNRADWPAAPQACTRVNLQSTLNVHIGAFFGDDNRNDIWDRPISGTGSLSITNEITLTEVSLRFLDPQGRDAVTPTVGDSWTFTTSVSPGAIYRLQAITSDYGRTLWLSWTHPGEVYTFTCPALGLWPLSHLYLPVILRRS